MPHLTRNLRRCVAFTFTLLAVLAGAGCSSPRNDPGSLPVASMMTPDAGRDGGASAPPDAGRETTTSAAPDAGADSGGGAGPDLGGSSGDAPADTRPDLRPDVMPPEPVAPNRMFVTSRTYLANLGGLAGADQKCADQARMAGLPGTFIAFLSTQAMPVLSRFGSARGWVRVDGRPFANTQADMIEGRIFYPPTIDESGRPITSPIVWTGTNTGGVPDRTGNDWRATATDLCVGGDAFNGANRWYQYYAGECTYEAHLYCFEVARTATVQVPPPAPGRRIAFVSRPLFDPSTGLGAADQLCAEQASGAGLGGSFRALLGTSGASPASRFDLGGPPWVRPDGVEVTAASGDLARGVLLAPVLMDATGAIDFNRDQVWTGAVTPGQAGSETCSDWSSKSAAVKAVVGSGAWFNLWFSFPEYRARCSETGRVYCFQQ